MLPMGELIFVGLGMSKPEDMSVRALTTLRIDMVRLLIDHGATVDDVDTKGKAAADWAREKGRLDIVELLTAARPAHSP